MRIIIPWMGVVLLSANLASPQISSQPRYFSSKIANFQFESLAAHSRQNAAGTLDAAPVRDDDATNWSRLNVTVAEKPFLLDYANFIANHNLTFVEFYVQIGYDRLSFTRSGKFYQAVYDIDFYIEDLNGNLLQSRALRDEAEVANYDETMAPNNSRVVLLNFSLNPGLYRLRAVITDKESGKSYETADKFSVRDFSSANLTVSDLQFSRNIQVDSSANAFVKHNRRIEPNVLRSYGQYAGQLFVYYEIYHLVDPKNPAVRDSAVSPTTPADSFRTVYIIRNNRGEEVKRLWKSSRKPGTSCVHSVLLPIADLKSGHYTLTVRVFDQANGDYAETTGLFIMQWDVLSFKDKKFEEILEQMSSVAGEDELKRLAQLPEADRQRGLFDFWQRRDPTPGTPRNEAMEEYYHRINYANAHFKWQRSEGWKSPQGRIYLTYGAPDLVQRYTDSSRGRAKDDWTADWSSDSGQSSSSRRASRPSSLFDASYEVWEYTQLNRRFVFVDLRGMGIYELANPLSLNTSGM